MNCPMSYPGNLYLHRKFPFNSANIFLPHLSCSDLSLHLPSFARISPEHQQSRGEPVQPRREAEMIIMIFSPRYWHSLA